MAKTISENLEIIKNATASIKSAIIEKEGIISGDITTWADAIRNIKSGSNGIKITNKLGGSVCFGYEGKLTHQYTFEGGEPVLGFIMPSRIKGHKGYDSYPYLDLTFTQGNTPNLNSVSYSSFVDYQETTYPSADEVNRVTLPSSLSCFQPAFSKVVINFLETLSVTNDGLFSYILPTISKGHFKTYYYLWCIVGFIDKDNNCDIDVVMYNPLGFMCYKKGTRILLSDKTYKPVEDITYEDNLLVWNFDEGNYDSSKPLWIQRPLQANYHFHAVFENGIEIDFAGPENICHRVFSIDLGRFEWATECVGHKIYTTKGITTLLSCDRIEEPVEYYNIITDYHMNLFCEDVLTSCRYNNLYPIENMKFIKDNQRNVRDYSEFSSSVPYSYYKGMRLGEQTGFTVEEIESYINKLEMNKK